MVPPPIPPSLEHLTARPFSFYPPILGVEHNEWLFRKATWSEILVVNCKSAAEIWIPRRFLGEVSRIDDPVLIVGLNRELEYKAGAVWPYQRRVIQMPVAVGAPPPSSTPSPPSARTSPAPIVGIRLESNDRRVFRLIGAAVAVAIAIYVLAIKFDRVGEIRQRNITFTAADQSFLELSSRDNYASIVQKLGEPASDRWRTDSGEMQFRALGYPDRGFTVILMGPDRNSALYIGTMDANWHPANPAQLPSGGTYLSLLRSLPRF